MAEPPRPSPDAGATGHDSAALDRLAWDVLTDLLHQHAGLGDLSADGLRQLIDLRLQREASSRRIPPEALGDAFDRALRELTGAGRPPRDERKAEEDDGGEGPPETIDDL